MVTAREVQPTDCYYCHTGKIVDALYVRGTYHKKGAGNAEEWVTVDAKTTGDAL
jgi:hypothetical protein